MKENKISFIFFSSPSFSFHCLCFNFLSPNSFAHHFTNKCKSSISIQTEKYAHQTLCNKYKKTCTLYKCIITRLVQFDNSQSHLCPWY